MSYFAVQGCGSKGAPKYNSTSLLVVSKHQRKRRAKKDFIFKIYIFQVIKQLWNRIAEHPDSGAALLWCVAVVCFAKLAMAVGMYTRADGTLSDMVQKAKEHQGLFLRYSLRRGFSCEICACLSPRKF